MDSGAWWATVHGVAKSRTQLSDFTFTFHFHALEKEMATYSSVLFWRIPGTAEPGGLLSVGSHRVGHDWSDLAAAAGHRYGKRYSVTTYFSLSSHGNILLVHVPACRLSTHSSPHTLAYGIFKVGFLKKKKKKKQNQFCFFPQCKLF